MRIEWTLVPIEGGTRLELIQSYENQPWTMTFAMGIGWRFYLLIYLPKRAYEATNLPGDVIV
jgi:hypothetical protein